MTLPLSPTHAPPGPGQLRAPAPLDPPFSPTRVEELMRLIAKAARAQQLYLPNNPIYHKAVEALRAGFVSIWQETDDLTLSVGESEMQWFDRVVAGGVGDAGGKTPDNLAWLFYKDGVRELTFLKGFEDEATPLLQMIRRARTGSADEDDLVTMLWEADFAFLKYRYVDLLQDGSGGELADGGESAPANRAELQRAAEEAVAESTAPGFVNLSDFDSTLYFLDEREIEYLHAEIRREYAHDLRTNVVSVLFDVFEAQADEAIRGEVIDHLQTMMVYLVAAGHFRGVARLLHEAQVTIERVRGLSEQHRARLLELAARLSAPDAFSQLLQALDETPTLPPEAELVALFDQLHPAALITVFQWLPKIQNEALRPLLAAAANRLAGANTAELVRLVQSPEIDVSSEAIRRVAALRTQAAVLAVSRILGEADVARRRLAVHALTEIASPGALQALERAVEDADRDVRIATVRALSARGYRPVLARLESVIKGKGIRAADLTEKMAFFEAYGGLCGDAGVAALDSILNGKGFLGRRDDPEVRACAATALGRVATPKAVETLRKASAEKDVVVRSAVMRALRGGGSGS